MITIGLDMSLSGTGLCILRDGAPVTIRTLKGIGKNKKQERDSIIVRVLGAINDLSERPAMICIEQALLHSKNMQGATQQITLTECMGDEVVDAGLPLIRIAQSTLKKFATGNGHAKKPEMIAAAKEVTVNPSDDNQADAFWLASIAASICAAREGILPGNPVQCEIIENILKRGW